MPIHGTVIAQGQPVAAPAPQPVSLAIPPDGVEFELTLGSVDPMQMLRDDGVPPQGWRFKGRRVAPGTTHRFKLERVGFCFNLVRVQEEMKGYGNIPEGLWREAFRQSFSRNDGEGPIGFADFSWVSPAGGVYFPMLEEHDEGWISGFRNASCERNKDWRWLVGVAIR